MVGTSGKTLLALRNFHDPRFFEAWHLLWNLFGSTFFLWFGLGLIPLFYTRRWFVPHWLAAWALLVVIFYGTSSILQTLSSPATSQPADVVVAFLAAAVGCAWLSRSKRVKATFLRP